LANDTDSFENAFHTLLILIIAFIALILLLGMFFSMFSGLTSTLSTYGMLATFIIIGLFAVSWVQGAFNVSRAVTHSSEHESGNRLMVPLESMLGIISGTLGILLVMDMLGFWGVALYSISFLPYSIFTDKFSIRRNIETKRITKAQHADFGIVASVVLLVLLDTLIYRSEIGLIGIAAFIAAITAVNVLREKDHENRAIESGNRVIVPVAMVGVALVTDYLYGILVPGGILDFLIPFFIIAVFGIIIMRLRKRYVFSMAVSAIFFLLMVYSLLVYFEHYGSYIVVSLITAMLLSALVGRHRRSLEGGFHKIREAFSLYRFRPAVYLIFFVSGVGIANLFGLIPFLSTLNYSTLTDYTLHFGSLSDLVTIQAVEVGILCLVVVSAMELRGTRLLDAILFTVVIFGLYNGLFSILSLQIPGFWEPQTLEILMVSVIVTGIVVYEPFFKFARSYTYRIPFKMSLQYQLGNAAYLNGRYDVNMDRNKKKNKDLLGAGGFAYVFRGRDVATGENVVIKVPRVYDEESKTEREKREFLQDAVRQLVTESKILSGLDHPGIVRYIDYFRENNEHYLVEEYADGKNLSSMLGNEGKPGKEMGEKEVKSIALSLLFAVNYLHLHEAYHRDLNPGNVVLTQSGPKIIDFGTSKSVTERRSTAFFSHSQRIGVPCYHPPELDMDGKIRVSASYDTYSVGALICSMLTGKFLDDEVLKSKYDYGFISPGYLEAEIEPKVSSEFYFAIKKSVSFSPDDRYKSAFEMIAGINGWKGEFLVSDLGEICRVSRKKGVEIILSSSVLPNANHTEYSQQDKFNILQKGRDPPVASAVVGYSDLTSEFQVKTVRGRYIYSRRIGVVPERGTMFPLHVDNIYSFSQDGKGGAFTFHRIY
jgi:serine/threonine protein kinase